MKTKDASVDRKNAGVKDTLSSAIFSKMREDILDGQLQAGEKLKIEDLKKRYHSGHSPIREALSRLLPGGLVEREDQKGFRVQALSRTDLGEITKVRCWLVDIAIRESIRLGDEDWEEPIVLAHHRLSKESKFLGNDKTSFNRVWEDLHREFHGLLFAACDSKWLIYHGRELHRLTERYRRNNLKAGHQQHDSNDEHDKIFKAVIDRDADLASELIIEHYSTTSDNIMESLPED